MARGSFEQQSLFVAALPQAKRGCFGFNSPVCDGHTAIEVAVTVNNECKRKKLPGFKLYLYQYVTARFDSRAGVCTTNAKLVKEVISEKVASLTALERKVTLQVFFGSCYVVDDRSRYRNIPRRALGRGCWMWFITSS